MVDPRGTVSLCAGRELHWRERGGSEPAVVLMSGCGLAMEFWRDVLDALDGMRVLAYDRPGMGGTAWPGRMPTLAEEVDSLAALLDSRQVRGAVLVAHSMAAFHAEALARVRPDLVSGVVLVDGSVEWYAAAPKLPGTVLPQGLLRTVEGLNLHRMAGLVFRFGTWLQSNLDFRHVFHGRIPLIYRDEDALAMGLAESLAYDRQGWDLQQLRSSHGWPGVATLVLSAAQASDGRWVADQARLARLLGARQVVVEHSRHLMMLDRPEVVAEAVRAVRPQ